MRRRWVRAIPLSDHFLPSFHSLHRATVGQILACSCSCRTVALSCSPHSSAPNLLKPSAGAARPSSAHSSQGQVRVIRAKLSAQADERPSSRTLETGAPVARARSSRWSAISTLGDCGGAGSAQMRSVRSVEHQL